MSITAFEREVYDQLRTVPRGMVTTYGWLARAAGAPGGGRAVGNAMNKNPFAPKVPCHRVVCSNGSLGGFEGGPQNKIKLLLSEGVSVWACLH